MNSRACTVSLTALVATCALAFPVSATASGPEDVRLKKIGSFDNPIYLTAPPKDPKRILVVQRAGKIIVMKKGNRLSKPFLDLEKKISTEGEGGLLSIAFSPRYAKDRKFYANYTNKSGDTRIVEFRVKKGKPNRANAKSARTVLKIKQPFSNHNGGQIQFGPDGYLHIGMGDGGSAGDPRGYAQNPQSLLGKMLRIDPRKDGKRSYRIPPENPFVSTPGVKPEIYSLGLRNPWRFSFDAENGALAIGDVGQADIEEIQYTEAGQASGANYGWPIVEGSKPFNGGDTSGLVKPVIEVPHSQGWCSITGGYVVRDSKSSAYGHYLYGDFCAGEIRSAVLGADSATQKQRLRIKVNNLVSFGEDARGRLYALSIGGPVYRLVG